MFHSYILTGPTAVGKTDIAIAVARLLDAEIIGADAFQIYHGLPILTAQPDAAAREAVPHHLIGTLALTESCDAGRWLALARAAVAEVHARGRHALLVGGTGMYLRAFTHGLADLPPTDAALRAELSTKSLPELLARLAVLDPGAAALLDTKNPRRVQRALEICIGTGRPWSEQRREWDRPNTTPGVVITRPREVLHARIAARTEAMFAAGVVGEVREAGPASATAAQTIGWREIRAHLDGYLPLAACREHITTATRQYAKRQETWFRKEPTWPQFDPALFPDTAAAAEHIARALTTAAARATP